MTEKKAEYAVKPYDEIVGSTMNRIAAMQNAGQIHFPGDYSPQNALQSAWLILQETKDKDKNPVLEVCKKSSIANALLDMVVQGLNPAKKQLYFIAYSKTLTCQRSYFGSMAVAKRVDPSIADFHAEVIFDDDEFEFEIKAGKKVVIKHKQTIQSINSARPLGAYCEVIGANGEIQKTEVMTFEEIKKAWTKSQTKPIKENGDIKAGSTHADYLVEMCKKTVINRTCKAIINSSSDKTLLESVNRQEFAEAEEAAAMQIEEGANTGPILDAEWEEPEEPEESIEEGPSEFDIFEAKVREFLDAGVSQSALDSILKFLHDNLPPWYKVKKLADVPEDKYEFVLDQLSIRMQKNGKSEGGPDF